MGWSPGWLLLGAACLLSYILIATRAVTVVVVLGIRRGLKSISPRGQSPATVGRTDRGALRVEQNGNPDARFSHFRDGSSIRALKLRRVSVMHAHKHPSMRMQYTCTEGMGPLARPNFPQLPVEGLLELHAHPNMLPVEGTWRATRTRMLCPRRLLCAGFVIHGLLLDEPWLHTR